MVKEKRENKDSRESITGVTKDLIVQYKKFAENADLYKKRVQEVSLAVADHKLRNIKDGERINLKEVIPHITEVYKQAYKEAHNPFWRWIKDRFRNSDRTKEIDFLNKVSEQEGCTEFIRHQAACLVYKKIIDTEAFGVRTKLGEGSKLAKLLEGAIKGKPDIVDGDEDLFNFLNNKDLQDAIPESLRIYLAVNTSDYLQKPKDVYQDVNISM